MRVVHLLPGMKIEGATFVARASHPIWPTLALVIWRMPDGGWSHDALDPWQEVGEPETYTQESRMDALKEALLAPGALVKKRGS